MSAGAQSGAQWLLRSAAASGIDVCFANPGTTELPFVAAMDGAPEVRPILSLFEGVCSGAADGYYRIAGRPAMTLTHLGPGFGNAIANLHNARRARSAVLNVIGEHMSWHIDADPPLASDIESLARPVSTGVWRAHDLPSLERAGHAALAHTLAAAPGIASLILPMDLQGAPHTAEPVAVPRAARPAGFEAAGVERVAAAVRDGKRVLLFLGAGALGEEALLAASRFAGLANVELVGETFPARSEHGGGLPAIRRFAYLPEQGHPFLLQFDCVALVEALHPVAFFGAEGLPSRLGDAARMVPVAAPGSGGAAALRHLADSLGLPAPRRLDAERARDDDLGEELTAENAARVVATWLPENAIVSAEGGTLGFPFNQLAANAARHSTIVLTGGAIGQGLPSAFGAAIAAPERKVVALQSDGSALFTAQALWSMARESADVVVVIASNRRYHILQNEMRRTGYVLQNPSVQRLLDLSGPAIDWQGLARGFGVPASRASTTGEFRRAFRAALAERGPRLIETVLP